jgi:D-alanyl-lipoteichoic acid acyltransferase DltB (MBOAT superfamily)
MLAVVVVKVRFDLVGRGLLPLTAFEMVQFYLLLAALADGLAALAALAGIRSDPVFTDPIGARSPVEFWSRRWNLVVHRFAKRQIFLPIARRVGPLPAMTLTFVASGLMHEYLVLASVGWSGYRPGLMLAFFALQALAVLATVTVTRHRRHRPLPRPFAAALHLGWLMATCALFFAPLRIQIGAFDATCLRVLAALLPGTTGVWP